jgi:hypothetical protein
VHFWVGGLVHLVDDFVRGGNLAECYMNCDAMWPNFVILLHGLLETHYISRVFLTISSFWGGLAWSTPSQQWVNWPTLYFKGVANYAFAITASDDPSPTMEPE